MLQVRKKAPSVASSSGRQSHSASPAHRGPSKHTPLHYYDLSTGAHKNSAASGSVEKLRQTIHELDAKLQHEKERSREWRHSCEELEKRNNYLATDLAHYVQSQEEANMRLQEAAQAHKSLALRDDEATRLKAQIESVTAQLHAEKGKVEKVTDPDLET